MHNSHISSPLPTLILFGPGPQSLDLAAQARALHVAIFVPTWEEVEQTRLQVEARRLSRRVSIHHQSAALGLGFLNPSRAA